MLNCGYGAKSNFLAVWKFCNFVNSKEHMKWFKTSVQRLLLAARMEDQKPAGLAERLSPEVGVLSLSALILSSAHTQQLKCGLKRSGRPSIKRPWSQRRGKRTREVSQSQVSSVSCAHWRHSVPRGIPMMHHNTTTAHLQPSMQAYTELLPAGTQAYTATQRNGISLSCY